MIMKKHAIVLLVFIAIFLASSIEASEFEELDKPPEGAHEGQMLLGGFISMGIPSGDIIDAEKSFLKNNYYTFENTETTKELIVNHLEYNYGICFEYMPIDHIGIKGKLRRATVIQRTAFGSDYRNWSKTLFYTNSFLAGPVFHLTNRRQWDISLNPLIGYGKGRFRASPVAAKLISGYYGDGERSVSGMIYGTELNLIIFFSGGFYLTIGGEYTYYPISFSPAYTLRQSGNTYSATNGGTIKTMDIIISAGYAFSN